MKIIPYNNVVIDLEKTALLTFFQEEATPSHYKFYVNNDGNVMTFDRAGIDRVRKCVEDYSTKGGNYWWPFSNVAVNLDVVSSVSLFNSQLVVSYPGGNWTSTASNTAATAFAAYKKYTEEKVSSSAAPKNDNKKKPSKAAMPQDDKVKAALENIDTMIGLKSAKRDMRQNIALARFNEAKADIGMDVKPISRHMVFTGNPGTGKTTFAREVAKVYHALGFLKTDNVVEVKREDLVAEYTGQTAPKVKAILEKAKGGVLFIDEAYSLVRDNSAFRDVFGTEAIDTLVAGMENMREDLVVIVAGYPEPMKKLITANEGLKSRFVTYIHFEDYSMEELGQIFDLMMNERDYTVTPEARAKALSLLENEKTDSFMRHNPDSGLGPDFANGREVRNIVEQIEKHMATRLDEAGIFQNLVNMTPEECKAVLSTVTLEDVADVKLNGLLGNARIISPVVSWKQKPGR